MRTYSFTSTIQRLLGVQALFRSPLRYPSLRTMSSSSISSADPDINRTLSYWFEGPDPVKRWFMGGHVVDDEIKSQFSDLVTKAQSSQLDSWAESPTGALAYIVVCDQFPRNIYRGSPLSFALDSKALQVAVKSIAKGFDREVSKLQQPFFYIPFMHDENLLTQVAAVALYEAAVERCPVEEEKEREYMRQNVHFAKLHRDVLLRFGRFPSRNEALGRESTEEEKAYLVERPGGF